MERSANDARWDPRPRLVGEAERVGADGAPEAGEGGAAGRSVLVELAAAPGMSPAAALRVAHELEGLGMRVDEEYGAVPMGSGGEPQTFVVRAELAGEDAADALERDARVVKVWRDTPIAPF